MSLFASIILIIMLLREARLVLQAHKNGAHPFWTALGSLQMALILVPLVAVWL